MADILEVIDMNGQHGDDHFWFKKGKRERKAEEVWSISFIVFVVTHSFPFSEKQKAGKRVRQAQT